MDLSVDVTVIEIEFLKKRQVGDNVHIHCSAYCVRQASGREQ